MREELGGNLKRGSMVAGRENEREREREGVCGCVCVCERERTAEWVSECSQFDFNLRTLAEYNSLFEDDNVPRRRSQEEKRSRSWDFEIKVVVTRPWTRKCETSRGFQRTTTLRGDALQWKQEKC